MSLSFIEGLIARLQHICKEIQRLCGWSAFMVVGGPNPLLNEKLIIHTFVDSALFSLSSLMN